DLRLRHELVDLDGARALDGDGLELLGLELDILALADFVAFDDVGRVDILLGLRVHFAVFDAVAGVLIDLMKADFFALAARGKQRDRTRDERQFEVAFPIRTRGHGGAPIKATRGQREPTLSCSGAGMEELAAMTALRCRFVPARCPARIPLRR